MQLTFVRMVSTHPQTIHDTLKLVERGRCRGVWIYLQPAVADKNGAGRRLSKATTNRASAVAILVTRLRQMNVILVVDSQDQNEVWQTTVMQGATSTHGADFRNTTHRWCSFLHPQGAMATATSQRIFSNLPLQSTTCACGKKDSEHLRSQTLEHKRAEFHFMLQFGEARIQPVMDELLG